ncbi:hypothetical protein EYF80_066613 [Liparis tanakae]|uniref:Uncharacterized protein n=1 Tax=Liparis tanakae TaxID=230148 RepID=A0A4Z2E3D2_9TELE|nr:hypothetical protein EYF80_066613 [Liparis tanakae]
MVGAVFFWPDWKSVARGRPVGPEGGRREGGGGRREGGGSSRIFTKPRS